MPPQDPNSQNPIPAQPEVPQQTPPPQPVFSPPSQPVPQPPQPVVMPQQPAPPQGYMQPGGAQQVPFGTNGSKSKKPFVIIIACVAALLIIGGGVLAFLMLSGKSDNKSARGNTNSDSIKSLLAEKKNLTKEAKVKDTINLEGFEITLSAVDQKTKLGEYDEAPAGKTFVIASIRTKNNTDHNVRITPYDFKFLTTQGQILNGRDVYDSTEKLPDGELAPKGIAQGLVLFEVPSAQITAGKIEYGSTYLPTDPTKSEVNYKATFTL